MKKVLLSVICLAIMLLFTSTVKSTDTKDGVLQIPKAAHPPDIDGVLDDIWYSASFERVVKLDEADTTPPEGYLDLFASMRVMWDDNNLYLFLHVVDDLIRTDAANPYENDSWEFYFDANNSKTPGAYDGVDDLQLRIEYHDVDYHGMNVDYGGATSWNFDTTGVVFNPDKDWERATHRTDPLGTPVGDAIGWNLEVSIPLEALQIEPEVGSLFGFDVQLNENDTGARDDMYRWWATSNDEWHWAELFGEAELTGYVADDYLKVPQTTAAPVIDGVLDDAWLDNSVLIQADEMNLRNGATIPAEFTDLEFWDDLQVAYRVMWDETAYYFWCEVIDDIINIATPNTYEQDGLEIYFDGDNSKGASYDDNDVHWSWPWSTDVKQTPGQTEEFAWGDLEGDYPGYTFELMVPAAEMPFTLEEGAVIGWEIQINENDGGTPPRKNMIRWWGEDNMSWQQPVLFGTAELGSRITAVEPKDVVAKPTDFALSQNYPNPFNPTTYINYTIAKNSAVELTVYDILGVEVAQIVNEVKSPGSYTVAFDGSNLASGVYFYKLRAGNNVITKKMLLMK
jgi:hypothetical protein